MVEVQAIGIDTFVKTKPFVVVGIPAFNEERTIASIILDAKKFADIVIVCDDGSSDFTAGIAQKLGAFVVSHEKNLGKGVALRTIFDASEKFNPDIVVTVDGDGQHDPKEIPQMIEPIINDECDIVLGSRYVAPLNYKIPPYRKVGLSLINWLNRQANGSKVKDSQNGFRAYNSKAVKIVSSSESKGFSTETEQITLAVKEGLRIKEVPVSTRYYGLHKTSKKSPLTHGMSLVGYLLKVMVEDRPLIFLGIPGLIFLISGVIFGAWMLQIYSVSHAITTNIALASIAFILIGFFSCVASIMLYSISRLSRKINNHNNIKN